MIRFLFLSIGGKIRLRFFATDGKKLTPSHNHCQTQYKKTAKKMWILLVDGVKAGGVQCGGSRGGVSPACFFSCLAARFSFGVCCACFFASLVLCRILPMMLLLGEVAGRGHVGEVGVLLGAGRGRRQAPVDQHGSIARGRRDQGGGRTGARQGRRQASWASSADHRRVNGKTTA